MNLDTCKRAASVFFLITLFIMAIEGVSRLTVVDIDEIKFGYSFTEWVINYSGGFVRRGFVGQILSYSNSEMIVPTVNIFVMLLYTANLIMANVLVKKAFNSYFICVLVMLAPAGLVQMAIMVDPDYCFARKEMLFFLFSTYCTFRTITNYQFTRSIVGTAAKNRRGYFFFGEICVFTIVAILIHEAFVFFSVPLLVVILCLNSHIFNLRYRTTLLLGYTLLVMGMTVLMASNHGTPEIARGILESLPNSIKLNEGFESHAIDFLGWTFDHQIGTVVDEVKPRMIILVTSAIPVTIIYLCCFPIVCRRISGVAESNINPLLLGLGAFMFMTVSTSPILFGIDWNRWITSIVIHSLDLIIILSVVKTEDLLNAIVPVRGQAAFNSLKENLSVCSKISNSTIVLSALILLMIWIGVNFQVADCCERFIDYHGAFNYFDSLSFIWSAITTHLSP